MATKAKKQAAPITEADIQKALKKFMDEGGLIQKLPDEVVPQRRQVGDKWSAYEGLSEGQDA